MAIPFFEPRATVESSSINNQQPPTPPQVDQVDGGSSDQQPTANQPSVEVHLTGQLSSLQSEPEVPSTSAATNNVIPCGPASFVSTLDATTLTLPPLTASDSVEQVKAWKMLAVTICKALKDYQLQTANSDDSGGPSCSGVATANIHAANSANATTATNATNATSTASTACSTKTTRTTVVHILPADANTIRNN